MKLSERAEIRIKKKDVEAPAAPTHRMVTRHSDGIVEVRGPNGTLVAHYNPRSNETRDHRGELIGPGNRLPLVLRAAEAAASQRGSRP